MYIYINIWNIYIHDINYPWHYIIYIFIVIIMYCMYLGLSYIYIYIKGGNSRQEKHGMYIYIYIVSTPIGLVVDFLIFSLAKPQKQNTLNVLQ